MNRDGLHWTWTELAVVLAIIVMISGALVSIVKSHDKRREALPQVIVNTNHYALQVGMATVEGHSYLIFDRGVVHNENCPCRSK